MNIKGITSLVLFSILASTLGFFTRMVEGIDLMTITFFRALLAAVFIFGFAAVTKSLKDLIPSNMPMLLVSGICQCGSMVLFIAAILYTSMANAFFLHQVAPICAILFSRIFLGEKISRSTLVGITISCIGILFVIDLSSIEFGSQTILGDMLALGSGVTFAGSMIAAKLVTDTNSSTGITFWQMVITTVALIPFIQMPAPAVLVDAAFPLIGLGCFASGAAYLFFMYGVAHLDGQTVMIIPNIGLMLPAFAAWFFLGETLSTISLIGCGLILIGIIASQVKFPAQDALIETGSIPAGLSQAA
ncbi:MAG: DMT family transporter [Anaerolineae bacterium]